MSRPPARSGYLVGADVQLINPTYPVYLGGYGAGRPGGTISRAIDPLTGQPENLTVRAVAFRVGSHAVEFATVDTQGDMAGYQEGPYGISDSRAAVARFLARHGVIDAGPQDIIVSSLHEHAAPSLFGVWAPPAHNVKYMAQVSAAVTRALELAFERSRPARLSWGTVNAPWLGGGNLAEGNEFEGWPRDGAVVAIRAVDARTGSTIATYTSEPAYPNIIYGPSDVIRPDGVATSVIAHDFPGYVEEELSAKLGGVTVVASGSLANQASPMQADDAPSPDLPVREGMRYTRGFDDAVQVAAAVTNLTLQAIGQDRPVGPPEVAGAEQEITTPVDNPALFVLGLSTADQDAESSTLGHLTGVYSADRSFTPPYGDVAAINTWVTGLRIGNLLFLSEPGELFYSIHQAWQQTITGAANVAVVGAAQDFLGYDYPATTLPFTLLGGDEHIFGPSAILGDQVVAAGERDGAALGFGTLPTGVAVAESSVTQANEAQLAQPGVLLTPSATVVDIDPRTRGAWVRFLASSDPPRTEMGCGDPALLTTPPGCPLPESSMEPFIWDFGDKTGETTPIQAHVRAFFSPFITHLFARPGRYLVTVSDADPEGQVATMTLPITVDPALRLQVAGHDGTYRAVTSGGDGHLLDVTWHLSGGRTLHGGTALLPDTQGVTVTAVDSAGGVASLTL